MTNWSVVYGFLVGAGIAFLFVLQYTWMAVEMTPEEHVVAISQAPLYEEVDEGDDKYVIPDVCAKHIRSNYVEEVCQTYGWTEGSNPTSTHIVVDQAHQLAYCYVPKVASRTMRTVLDSCFPKNKSKGPSSEEDFKGFTMFDGLEPQVKERVLNTFTKILVVRHPLDRVISSYVRFASPTYLTVAGLTDNIPHIEDYFGNNRQFDIAKDSLTFKEYVDLIATRYEKGYWNEHWATVWETCDPCKVHYDFILRTETLADDFEGLSELLRKKMSIEDRDKEIELPHITRPKLKNLDPRMKIQRLATEYRNVSRETMAGLRYVYHKDMTLFGYTWYDSEGGACSIPNGGQPCC